MKNNEDSLKVTKKKTPFWENEKGGVENEKTRIGEKAVQGLISSIRPRKLEIKALINSKCRVRPSCRWLETD